jgi:hypothetical protein
MTKIKSTVSGLLSVAAALLLTSCGTESDVRPTITVRQAEQKVEDYFRQALAELPPQARPEPGLIDTYDCDDPTDNGPQGRKIASVDYDILGLPRDEYPEYINKLERWWRDHNFRVLDDERPKRDSIWVENNDDGFRMRVTASKKGKLILIATSPCVWENGTPEPE